MKISKHIVSASLVILFSTTGCNDFLDKAPLDELTESTAFITYDNFKTYSWKLYETFSGFPTDGGYTPSNISSEYNSDNMINAQTGGESDYAYQLNLYHPLVVHGISLIFVMLILCCRILINPQ